MENLVTKQASEQEPPSAKGSGASSIEVKRRRSAAIREYEIDGKLSRKSRQHISFRFFDSLSQVAIYWQNPMHRQRSIPDSIDPVRGPSASTGLAAQNCNGSCQQVKHIFRVLCVTLRIGGVSCIE